MLLISFIILSANCNYHNKDDYFNEACDTVDMSFSKDINPIIQKKCVPCHNYELYYNGRIYETYEGVKEVAETGLLLEVINHSGNIKMPKDEPKLPDCEIDKFEAWVNQGFKNN